ncbi:glycogen debranching protein GlgX [Actinomyces bovis]
MSEPTMAPAQPAYTDVHHPHILGATPVPGGTDFVVAAPRATAVDLCLLEVDGSGAVVSEKRVGMLGPRLGTWSAHVEGVGAGQCYGYRVYGPWNPSEGLLHNPQKLVLDPYARALHGEAKLEPALFSHEVDENLATTFVPAAPSPLDSRDSMVFGVVVGEQFPVVPGPQIPREQRVVYEAHVKGLTLNLPGVPEELRGTYAGLAHPATVAHLRSLGVTTIELLPIHAAFSEPFLQLQGKRNYWGYSTLSWFAPEPSYATASARAAGAQAVLAEVRGMISMLHEAGLEVIMDVVYNHTCEGGIEGPTLSLRGLDDRGYYLHAPFHHGQYYDVTGTGNTVDFRNTRAVQLALDSLRYWAGDMGVDGFRFDLASTLGREGMEFRSHHPLLVGMVTDPILAGKILIAEPWDMGPGGWRTGEFPSHFQDWNDRYRGTVRSFWLADAAEISKGRPGADLRDLATRLSGSADLFGHGDLSGGRGPLASVNFVTAHDGFTLRDLTVYDHKHNLANGEDNRDGTDDNRSWNHGFEGLAQEGLDVGPLEVLRRRSARNILATMFVSAGTPMLLGGDELGRTQQGNNNCYCQDSELSWVDWRLEAWQRDLIATTRFLIGLRAHHPVLRPATYATGSPAPGDTIPDLSWYRSDGAEMSLESWHDPYCRCVQMLRSGAPVGDQDLLVLINGALDQVDFTLPQGRGADYHLVWDSNWPVPRPHSSAFALAHRVRRPRATASVVRDAGSAPLPPFVGCRHDRPGDTTAVDALTVRIYLSGEHSPA